MKINWPDFLAQHDLIYERPGKAWPDGIPLGNGALAYAPTGPEFVINKTDVGDYRRPRDRRLTHRELLAFIGKGRSAAELDRLEMGDNPFPTPKSCAILRLALGAIPGWAAMPRIQQRLSLQDARLSINLDIHTEPGITIVVYQNRRVYPMAERKTFGAERTAGPRSLPLKDGSVVWLGKRRL